MGVNRKHWTVCSNLQPQQIKMLLSLIYMLLPTFSKSIEVHEISSYMPDNETTVELRLTLKNRSNSTQPPLPTDLVPSVLLSPAVLDQVVGAVTKALAVEDKKEAILVGSSVRTALKSMITQGNGSAVNVTQVDPPPESRGSGPRVQAIFTLPLPYVNNPPSSQP